ncbi:hypothetical protein Hanom_Chr15g01358111 [Helianthus anomalus]
MDHFCVAHKPPAENLGHQLDDDQCYTRYLRFLLRESYNDLELQIKVTNRLELA